MDTTAAARTQWPELFVVWRWERPVGGGGGESLGGVFYILGGACYRAPSLDALLGARAHNASTYLLDTLTLLRSLCVTPSCPACLARACTPPPHRTIIPVLPEQTHSLHD